MSSQNPHEPFQYELPLEPSETHSPYTAVNEDDVIAQAFRILCNRHRPGAILTSPEDTRNFIRLKIAEELNEVFGCLFLDNRHRVIAVEELFTGTIDGASVHPRVVVQQALKAHNAAAVIFFHNHPSGVVEPSQADLRITQRLKEALALVDIRVLDHVIVSHEGSTSLAERGLL
ncbi:putative DNA binding protein, possibly associated to lesions; CP4-6 prophage [Thiocapsa sp. KS1]|nr:DNA repair protein RadC [Thiocapsa sp. KS1]CRI66940.1 putative DNA binding protein, possibly associated to lesions; CP4-6 prophage [Thiocapsa sp. KS1]